MISRKEWAAAVGTAVGLTVVMALPYMLGYLLANPGTEFTGVLMNPEDTQSYFAKMLQGFDGQWLYRIPFTLEEHDPAFLGGFYLLLGHLARLLGSSLEAAWFGARAVSSVILFITTFVFTASYLKEKRIRWTAYLIAVLGSGLGWLLFLINQPYWLGAFPVDFKMPEAHLFFSALTFPHGMIGTALIMASFLLLEKALNSDHNALVYSLLAGSANLLLAIVYPFLIYLVGFSYGFYWLFQTYRRRKIQWVQSGLMILPLVIPLPLYAYYYYTYQINDVFRSWSDQAVTSSPAVPHYLVAYGIPLVLSALPLLRRELRRSYPGRFTLLWSWVISAALLVYAPVNPQRRFVQGLQVPLSILAAVGFYQVVLPWLMSTKLFKKLVDRPRYSTEGLERLAAAALIAFMALSNIYVLASMSITAGIQKPYPFFRDEHEVSAVEWLREQNLTGTGILSAYESGNYIAARSGASSFVGHWAETASWDKKMEDVDEFFDGQTSDSWRMNLLDSSGISLVWYGSKERELGDFNPSQADYLHKIYDDEELEIYAFP